MLFTVSYVRFFHVDLILLSKKCVHDLLSMCNLEFVIVTSSIKIFFRFKLFSLWLKLNWHVLRETVPFSFYNFSAYLNWKNHVVNLRQHLVLNVYKKCNSYSSEYLTCFFNKWRNMLNFTSDFSAWIAFYFIENNNLRSKV